MTDDQKLEILTDIFTKAILKFQFENAESYAALAKRLAVIIDAEVKENLQKEINRKLLLPFWGALTN